MKHKTEATVKCKNKMITEKNFGIFELKNNNTPQLTNYQMYRYVF